VSLGFFLAAFLALYDGINFEKNDGIEGQNAMGAGALAFGL
jgi:hypothetical protein